MSGQLEDGVFTVTLKDLLNIIKGKVMSDNKKALIVLVIWLIASIEW